MLQAKFYLMLFMVIGFFGTWKPFEEQHPLPFITGVSSVFFILMCIALFTKSMTIKALSKNQYHMIALGHFLCSFYFKVVPVYFFWHLISHEHWLMSIGYFILIDCVACWMLIERKRKSRYQSSWRLSSTHKSSYFS